MDIRRLEAFAKVYELGSFSKAAQELFLSQPTISAHVASLEEELGLPLFDRLGRGILPTAAADILHRRAGEAFEALALAKGEIEQLQQTISGQVRVGASTIPADHLLPQAVAAFLRAHPRARVRLHGGDTAEVTARVAAGELDFGVVGACAPAPELAFSPLTTDELVVVVPPDHGWADQQVTDWHQLLAWPWIVRERGSGTRTAFDLWLVEQGLDPAGLDVRVEVQSSQAALACVRAGTGVSVVSRLAAAEQVRQGAVAVVGLPGQPLRRMFHVVRHARRRLFPATEAFLTVLTRLAGSGERP